jgi:DNA ligase-1
VSHTLPLTRPCEYDATSKAFQKAHPSTTTLALRPDRIALAKYDGVCGLAVFERGTEARMLSRTGEDYSISCQGILNKLSVALGDYGWDGTPLMLAGEVWRHDCAQSRISGDFRQQRATIWDFQFRLFDMVYLERDLAEQPYYQRLDRYRELAYYSRGPEGNDRTHIAWANTLVLGPNDTPEQVARTMGPGYDGIVLWDLHGLPLLDKRATGGEAVKFKNEITLDVRCTGGGLGQEGKHSSRLGYLSYATKDGKTGTVGTGFSDKQRESLWRCLNDPTVRSPVGLIFEVEAMGFTPDGNLREPRFKGWRYDKKESD